MGTPADIFKLVERMKRAETLTDRAATASANGDQVMNAFEQTLERFSEHMTKVAEYEQQLSTMLSATGNGGPPLEQTPAPTPVAPPVESGSARLLPRIDLGTGDPIRS